jgi:hypothetical protein
MRALRVFGMVTLLVSAGAVGLFAWTATAQLPDIDIRGYFFLLAGGVGFILGMVTVVTGLVVASQRRQSAWVIGLLAAWLCTIIGPLVAGVLASSYQPTLPSVCQVGGPTPPPAGACQFVGVQLILADLPTWLFLAGPLLVGLVALSYSLRMRAPRARRTRAAG